MKFAVIGLGSFGTKRAQSIKNSNFSGSVLEDLYNLVYKLQTSYNKLK